ncbi:sporulation peptidase YabG [Alkalicella caledoniensis]|uniref:Sporulation peptidase YabG n=1 Tax=Alkalicella caledoniensis TaxID=2731377 RepID=A0A7G9W878_ALKCA|nr:sporulation peptidase YabG [Alkalicella caledoniensis]QNO14890.1 sporulation peptidase YabG [Alkalicella caledoniensis]
MEFNIGDIVGRRSYGNDIYFEIISINKEKEIAYLKGVDVRLLADAQFSDLSPLSPKEISEYRKRILNISFRLINDVEAKRTLQRKSYSLSRDKRHKDIKNYFEVPGTIVHLDGDKEYLDICTEAYKELGLKVYPYHIPESEQPKIVRSLLKKHNPDTLVLTGHDGLAKKHNDFTDLKNYRTSKYFVDAVLAAREFEPNRDDLVIFAGACQSHYEAILDAGANFASSPQRILIHCLDPVFIMEKINFTSIMESVCIYDVIENTITGIDGIGGMETRGKFRLGLPKSPYSVKGEKH